MARRALSRSLRIGNVARMLHWINVSAVLFVEITDKFYLALLSSLSLQREIFISDEMLTPQFFECFLAQGLILKERPMISKSSFPITSSRDEYPRNAIR